MIQLVILTATYNSGNKMMKNEQTI